MSTAAFESSMTSFATSSVATMALATGRVPPESKKVVRCPFCPLVQYQTISGNCRKCHRPLPREVPSAWIGDDVLSFDHKKLIGVETHDQLVAGIACVVKARRKAMNLSQRALAKCLKTSRTYISKIERGRILPTIDLLERIAQELGMSMALLLSFAAIPPSDFRKVFEEVFFPEEILQYFHRANAADQVFFREFAEYLFFCREQHM